VVRKFNISDEVIKSHKNLLGHTFNIQKPEWFVKKNHHKKWENPPRMFERQHVNKQGEGGVLGLIKEELMITNSNQVCFAKIATHGLQEATLHL